MVKDIKISPSILASNFSQLGDEVIAISEAGADYIHVDVMDGHFVPNLTIGPGIVKSIRDKTTIPFDVHLMIDPVQPYIDEFVKAGANIISIHPEASDDTSDCLTKIKSHNIKAGLAINPDTSWEVVKPYMDILDLILVMSVHPGFGGQKFIPTALNKLQMLTKEIDKSGRDIELEIDGGINFDNIQEVIDAGANVIVAGTTAFQDGPSEYANNIKRLRGQ
jgi:ribulose-phosphate 3-epimerase